MKIAIVGSRKFKDREIFEDVMEYIEGGTLISGGAYGIDSWAEEYYDDLGWNKIIFKPEYDKYGKRACAIRNQKIIDTADKVYAFWDGVSKGTKMSIDMAIKAGKPVNIYVRS